MENEELSARKNGQKYENKILLVWNDETIEPKYHMAWVDTVGIMEDEMLPLP